MIVHGTIVTSSGAPFANGTGVALYALPPSAELSSLAVGDSYAGTEVASSQVGGGDGSYYLSMENTSVLNQFRNNEGIVSFEVIAQDTAGQTAQYDFTRLVTPRTGAQPAVGSGSGVDGTADDGDADTDDGSTAPGPAITALAPASSSSAAAARSTSATPAATVQPATQDCTNKLLARYNAIPTVVGATYSTSADGGQGFSYVNGSSSHIGVGVSVHSDYGFKLQGEYSIDGANTNTSVYGQEKGVKSYRYTQNFDYGKFRLTCSSFPGGAQQLIDYYVHPIAYNGPNTRITTSPPSATHCNSKLSPNQRFIQSSTTATTYGAGADLSVASQGLTLSARSGYNSGVTATFWNNSTSKVHYLCGTAHDAGASQPGRIVFK